jgi:hypothetical protein
MNQGNRWVLFIQKIRHRKSHAWAPLSKIEGDPLPILQGGGGAQFSPNTLARVRELDGQHGIRGGASRRPSALLEIFHILLVTVVHQKFSMLLFFCLEKTTNSQDRFPVIQTSLDICICS